MKHTTFKILSVLFVSVSLSFCGQASNEIGTGGGSFQVVDDEGNSVTIESPWINAFVHPNGNIKLSFELDAYEHFTHFEIERKTTGNFAFLADLEAETYTDSSTTGGINYTYRARAVYIIDGVTHLSEYSNEVSKTALLSQAAETQK